MSNQIRLVCKYCGKRFSVNASLYRQSVKRKASRRFCSRNCSAVARSMASVKSKFNQWSDFEEKLRKALLAHRPVTTFKEMSPEKQAEMKRLYEKPASASPSFLSKLLRRHSKD